MIKPENCFQEEDRINALESYSILDTLPEADYDNLTMIASQICQTPIALIGFIDADRQWIKSSTGLEISETPREITFCGHAINDPNTVLMVPDARNDIRFHDNPAVNGQPHIVFYAGVPLVNEAGIALGTICVIDTKPKTLTNAQIESLKALSEQTMNVLELRLNKLQLEKTLTELQKTNEELERFAYTAAHDLKSPLANIAGLSDYFINTYGEIITEEGKEIINLIKSASAKLKQMIDGLLANSKSNAIEKEKTTKIVISELSTELNSLFAFNSNCTIQFVSELVQIQTNKTALDQILINLIGNAIKYNDKENIEIKIQINEIDRFYQVIVSDNGPGILIQDYTTIFEPFTIIASEDRFGNKGNGIGLATVKKMVETLGGTISVSSGAERGAVFTFTLPG